MAGPGVSILFDFARDETVVAAIRDACHSTATHIEGDDFWVESTSCIDGSYAGEGRPFIMWFADSSDDLELGEDISLYATALGWLPKLTFGLAAMCNQDADHRILAELSCYICNTHGGAITMHGDFDYVCRNRTFRERFHGHPDVVTVELEDSRSQLFQPSILADWMAHPEFRMLK